MHTSLLCLALAVFQEARGEPEVGQIAVAQVVLNRAAIRNKTTCDVLVEPGQFSWNHKKYMKKVRSGGKTTHVPILSSLPESKKGWKQSVTAAKKAINSGNSMGGIEFFHATYVHPDWRNRLLKIATIGNHVFYARKHPENRLDYGQLPSSVAIVGPSVGVK